MSHLYSLSGRDNDSHMCGSTDRVFLDIPGLPVCPACGYKTDTFFINPKFRVKRRSYDLSYTYDGYAIASLKFKEACARRGLTGVAFLTLPLDKEFFVLQPTTTVKFDVERRKTQFVGFCEGCGLHRSVAGATPAVLKEQPSSDIAGTDVLFGSGNERHPLLIATENAKSILTSERLTGMEFERASA